MFTFFTSQSIYSDPGKWIDKYDKLPDKIDDLVKFVQNIIIHQFWISNPENYGITPKSLIESGRKPNEEINLLTVEKILSKYFELNDSGFDVSRKPEEQVVGNCRDFTLMLVSFLRQKGIASRSRSGVAKYFIPNHYEDHFVCEYYNESEKRWIRVDAQLDQLMIDKCDMKFDVLDVPHDEFLDAAESMVQVRIDGKPEQYGINEYKGQKYLNYKLFSDIAHMNKLEILPWEGWGIGNRAASENLEGDDQKVLDMIENTLKEQNVTKIQELFANDSNFVIPKDYKPFFLELPFFRSE